MEIYEEYCTVVVKKHTTGKKLKTTWERVIADDHPSLKDNPDKSQYAYVTVEAPFSESRNVFEVALNNIDLDRIIRASKEKK